MKSDTRGTVDWGKKSAHFDTEKSEVVLFDRSNNSVAIDMWMDGFILEKNDLLRYWSNLSKLNWIRALILTIAKTVSKKIETLISCLKFLCLEVALYFFKGTIRPGMENYVHVCAGASRCFIVEISSISYRNGYVGPLLFHLYLSWTLAL